MMNYENKKEHIIKDLVKIIDALDADLIELSALNGTGSRKKSLKKWYAEKKALHEIKKLLHDINKYEKYDEKEMKKIEKEFEHFDEVFK